MPKTPSASSLGQKQRWAALLPRALAWTLAIVGFPLYAFKVFSKTDYTDFLVYYRAATRFHAGDWAQIYTTADGASPYRYAPLFLPWLEPLAELPRQWAQLAWYGVQVACFAWGFWLLWQTLRVSVPKPYRHRTGTALAVGFLFVFRLLLDTFTIGQVSGLLFLGFAFALWGFVRRRTWATGLGVTLPAWLKIGPGVLFLLIGGVRDPRRRIRGAIAVPLLMSAALFGVLALRVPDPAKTQALWSGWRSMIVNDSVYYDASHYGSQSLKSVLLRAARGGWIGQPAAESLYLVALGLGILALVCFWWLRRPKDALGRALFFSLGLFAVMIFMPETFKYSLTPLAIPVSLLVVLPGSKPLVYVALGFGAAVISLAGKDIVGDVLFFGIQRLNLPAYSVWLLGVATVVEAWRRSKPSLLWQWSFPAVLEPWRASPSTVEPERGVELWITLPLHSQTRLTPQLAKSALSRVSHAISESQGLIRTVVFAPFGNRTDPTHPITRHAQEAALRWVGVSVRWSFFDEALTATAMEARSHCFLNARGPVIACVSLEQMISGQGLARAMKDVASGTLSFVSFSRRHPDSRLRFAVSSLSRAYSRFRAGKTLHFWLERFTGSLAPFSDTGSQAFVIERRLADQVFPALHFAGFAALVELHRLALHFAPKSVACRGDEFLLPNEKRWAQLARESAEILLSLPLLLLHRMRLPQTRTQDQTLPSRMTADDWGLSRAVNDAILELAELGVIRRVSILTAGEALDYKIERLVALQAAGRVTLGVHFNLTYGEANMRWNRPHKVLLRWLALSNESRKRWALGEFHAQLAELAKRGAWPEYLDGHHHVHSLPGMLRILGPALQASRIKYVRIPYDPKQWWGARAPLNVLALLAGRETRLERAPVYYPPIGAYRDRLRLLELLREHPDSEIICHPATHNDLGDLAIPEVHYQNERVTEYRTLKMLGQWMQKL